MIHSELLDNNKENNNLKFSENRFYGTTQWNPKVISKQNVLEVGSGDDQQATATWESIDEAENSWMDIFKDDSSSGDATMDEADAFIDKL